MENMLQLIDKLPMPFVLHNKNKIVYINAAFSDLLAEPKDLAALDFTQWLASTTKNPKDSNLLIEAMNNNSEISINIESYSKGILHHWKIYSCPVSLDITPRCDRFTYLLDASASYFSKSYWDLHLRVSKATIQLIKEIDERKKAEEKASLLSSQLVSAARRAGMADIATSVLHNVGNVLNSINTSLSLIRERITHSKISHLANLAVILKQYLEETGAADKENSKGKQVLEYLTLVTEDWNNNDKKCLLEELHRLDYNIDHINKIITTQQALSGTVGLTEEAFLENLLQDALTMNKTAYERAHIEIICDYKFNKKVTVDKVKLLQILTNLIKNGIDSLVESKLLPKKITLCIKENDDSHFIIQVSDNGIGVPPEHITKIFSYGFTTKKNGHGFGLHTSAISAKEMGGSLFVESEGKNKGATFNLILPLLAPTRRNTNESEGKFATYSD